MISELGSRKSTHPRIHHPTTDTPMAAKYVTVAPTIVKKMKDTTSWRPSTLRRDG
jgi:hypothetical protein